MRRSDILVTCGRGATPPDEWGAGIALDLHGPARNVVLRIEDIRRALLADLEDHMADLLEIASYVYAADSAISRGGRTGARMGERWRRSFVFDIPVRCPGIWESEPVVRALSETLGFLSDDDYRFRFRQADVPPEPAGYFEFGGNDAGAFLPHDVVLFSGGLDSLAGTLDLLAGSQRSIALVSHRSSTKVAAAQAHLVSELRRRFSPNRIMHIPVRMTLEEHLTKETTHRNRSFLFMSLAAVVASLFGLDRLTFF
jgi:hypothetical protein